VSFSCLATSSATSYDACVLDKNFQQEVSDVSNSLHGVGRILNFMWRDWDSSVATGGLLEA